MRMDAIIFQFRSKMCRQKIRSENTKCYSFPLSFKQNYKCKYLSSLNIKFKSFGRLNFLDQQILIISLLAHQPRSNTIYFQAICISFTEICCTSVRRKHQCLNGKLAAHDGGTCQPKADEVGSAAFKDCCLACKLGLGMTSSSNGVQKQTQLCKQVKKIYFQNRVTNFLGQSNLIKPLSRNKVNNK